MAHSQTDLTEVYMSGDELLDLKMRCIHSNFLKVTIMGTPAAAAASTPDTNNNVSTEEMFRVFVHGVILLIVVLLLIQHFEMQLLPTRSLLGEFLIASYLSLYLIAWQLEQYCDLSAC